MGASTPTHRGAYLKSPHNSLDNPLYPSIILYMNSLPSPNPYNPNNPSGIISTEPPFWQNQLQAVPVCQSLVANYKQIRSEVVDFISIPYSLHDYPRHNVSTTPAISKEYLYENSWKVCPVTRSSVAFDAGHSYTTTPPDEVAVAVKRKKLENPEWQEPSELFMEEIIKNVKARCPTLQGCIAELEGQGVLMNGFISKIMPGTRINPHRGMTQDSLMRIHLGLVCDPLAKLTVGNESHAWTEGGLLAFKDSGDYMHSVEHLGVSERIILSVDISLDYLAQYVPNINMIKVGW